MSVGHARIAIGEMLRLPRPRPYRPLWIGLVASVAVASLALVLLPPLVAPVGLATGAIGIVVFGALLLGRLWTWLAVALALGAGLGLVPLLGVLGFELAVIASAFTAIMGADLGSALAREMQRVPARGLARSGWPGRTIARNAAVASSVVLAITLIPAVFAAIRGLWIPTCDWWFGIKAYALMPVVTAVLAGATGYALGALVGPRRFFGAFVAQVPAIGIAFAAFWRFYTEPPVFTYNAILGYFPGNLYDENVTLGAPLLWSRIEQLLWVGALVAVVAIWFDVPDARVRRSAQPAGRRLDLVAIALACALGGLALHLESGRLGYAIDAEDIQDALGGRRETEHFVIYHSTTPEIVADMDVIAADHELRYAQVVAQIGKAPAGKLRSYYFANRDQKWQLFGAKDVEMAKPWLGDIYLDHRSFPHSSLRHEIAHAIAGDFGDPIFGVAARRVLGLPVLMSPALIEGLAVALDWPMGYDRPNPHESVRAMQELNAMPRLSQLFGLQFFSVSSARGYTTAGSFLRFLLERYGPAKLRAVYGNGGDFEAAYGVARSQLEREWRDMLATIVLPKTQVDASAERFRGTSVFARPCPHAIAARRERAFRMHGDDRPRAIQLMRQVCKDAPEEPRHRLELGDFLAGGTPAERAEGEQLWAVLASDDTGVTSSLRAQAYERLARIVGSHGDLMRAGELVALARKLPIEPVERRTLDGMAIALAHPGPAGPALRAYFFPAGIGFSAQQHALTVVAGEPHFGLGHYLLGLQRANAGDWAGTVTALDRALARGLPGIAFTKNAARRLAIAAYRQGDHNALSVAITVLSGSEMSSGDRLLARDWLDRIAFEATGAVYLHPAGLDAAGSSPP